ncbi:MAG TPA: lanthionine synthetase LanC family protein, partial [Mycobacterium sp.]|nr:lanthionine synthetase LanC family protein [Mycobacterium sp.]
MPGQGWKLHVSANEQSAIDVLTAAVPILVRYRTAFKVVASLRQLHELNHGEAGQAQVGKFVTAYPVDDDTACRLAADLDAATTGLSGPRVPSDRPVRRGGVVHYRYGSFGGCYLQTKLGETVPAIVGPAGEMVADRRETYYLEPPGTPPNPFERPGVVTAADRRERLGRYQLVAEVSRSGHNEVWFALDTERLAPCIVKKALADVCCGNESPAARLMCEADALRRLAGVATVPRLLDVVTDESGQPCLVLEDVPGRRLDLLVADAARSGALIAGDQVLDIARRLVRAVAEIHDGAFLHTDIKAANILLEPGGAVRVIDWDNCVRVGGADVVIGRGTAGYASPQRAAGEPASTADDIYSIGAVLFLLLTGAEPASRPGPRLVPAPDGHPLRDDVSAHFEAVIGECLDPDPARRPRDASQLGRRLDEVDVAHSSSPPRRAASESAREPETELWRSVAWDLRADLIREMSPVDGRPPWLSRAADGSLHPLRDINSGVAGVLLGLCDLAECLDDDQAREAVGTAASWLARSRPLREPGLPGLFVGEIGVGIALLRCSEVLQDQALRALAQQRMLDVASLTHESADLFNGTAGRLRGHLACWRLTADSAHLRAAIACGDHLVRTAGVSPRHGGTRWQIPPGYGGLSGSAYLGYAHGSAGIADVLRELYEITGRAAYLDTVLGVADDLSELAQPDPSCNDGASWPQTLDASPHPPLWCHGAAGIGLFFLHLHRAGLYPQAESVATRAMRSVARARWIGPVICHGLAGNLLALLEARQLGVIAADCVAEAPLAASLRAFIECGARRHPSLAGPDYLIGRAGLGAAALAIAGHLPRAYAMLMNSF